MLNRSANREREPKLGFALYGDDEQLLLNLQTKFYPLTLISLANKRVGYQFFAMSRSIPTDTLPPAARSIALLLASTPTIQDAQPGVLHQLLEFSHRYTSQVLSDALVYAEHAGRQGKIEMDDVVLAIQARVGWELGGRIPKEVRVSLFVLSQ